MRMCSTGSDGICILIEMNRSYCCEKNECIHKYEKFSYSNRSVGGEELENRHNRNNKAITQENPPNNSEDLPNNYADCKIQVGGFSFYKVEIQTRT